MTPYYSEAGIEIYHGDARDVLPALPTGVADAIITDPVWPNSTPDLKGWDRPAELFAEVAAHFPRLANRAVIQMGCDSDPRFLAGMPIEIPFIRSCQLEYVLGRPKGRILYTGDVAYVFGVPPAPKPGRMIIPGRMMSTKADTTRPRTQLSRRKSFEGRWTAHPCPRRLEHLAWLVKWLSDGLVLDPFCGIGTTLLAQKNAGLPAIGIEIEEVFCERAAKRMEQSVMFGPSTVV
jgi:hypothetical protein